MANFKPQKDNLRRWNKTAIRCYNLKCNCIVCDYVPNDLKKYCKVRYYVPALKEKFGEPPKERG